MTFSNYFYYMKKFLILILLLPLFAHAQYPDSAKKLTPNLHALSFNSLYATGASTSNNQVGYLDLATGKWNGLATAYQLWLTNTNSSTLYKLKSDSTSSTGYQTVGNFFPKGDTRYAQIVSGGYVPTTRTITINGTTQDLSANRTYTVTSTGIAGGDLTGTYPNPTVNTINSITKSYYDPTSSIQTQINAKAPLSSPTFIGTISTPITRLTNVSGVSGGTDSLLSKNATTNIITKIPANYYAPATGGAYVSSVAGTTNRITSTGGTTPAIDISSTFEALLGKVANPLSQFASTTSAQLRATLSDETGTGLAYFQGGDIGTPSAGVGTNLTGIPNSALNNSSLTIGSTNIALGATAVTIAGLTLTAPIITGTPSTPSAGVAIGSSTANRFNFTGQNGFLVSFNANGLTASRGFVLPDAAGTLATTNGGQTFTSAIWTATKIAEIYGGTNQSTYTTGDLLQATSTNTLSKLGIGSTGNVLTVSGGVSAWGTVSAALGYTPVTSARSLTINGAAFDLSADRSWSVGTVTSITPGWSFTSSTPITNTGSLITDSTKVATVASFNPRVALYSDSHYVKKNTTIVYADNYTDSLATSIFNNGAGVNTGSAIVKALVVLNSAGGGTLVLSAKRYLPTGYTGDAVGHYMPYNNITIQGGGSGMYADSMRTITGGTVIQGSFYVFANNFHLKDVSVDAGKTVTHTYYNDVAYSAYETADYTGDFGFRSNHTYENIRTLVATPLGSQHSFLVENIDNVFMRNITTAFGFAGVVIKSSNVDADGLYNYGSTSYGMVIKADNIHAFVTGNVNIGSFTYAKLPSLMGSYITVPLATNAVNIDSYNQPIGTVDIKNVVVKDTTSIAFYVSSRLGANVTSGLHVGNLIIEKPSSAAVQVDGHAVDNYTFDNVTIYDTFAYIFVKQDSLNNKNANIGNINATQSSANGHAGILLNVNGASSGSWLNINNYNLNNQTYAYFVPDTANNHIQVQNEFFWSGLTNRNVASPTYYTDKLFVRGLRANTVTVNGSTQLLINNPSFTVSNTGVLSAIGTTNQINVSSATGNVTFSLPQSICTTCTPTFGRTIFSDGTQGFQVGAYTGGSGYGALYNVGVTPGSTNFVLAGSDSDVELKAVNTSGTVQLIVGSTSRLLANNTGVVVAGNLAATLPAYSTGTNLPVVYNSTNSRFETSTAFPKTVASARVTAQTALASVGNIWTVGASDGSFTISANVLVTSSTLHSFGATCTYTDESNTSRILTLNFSQLTGAFITAITNGTGASAYEGVPVHIRAKAGTSISVATAGTFTSVTYNAEWVLQQIN